MQRKLPKIEECLRDEYARRNRRNPTYSLRAFARDLGISPGFLSQVLTGKRGIGEARTRRLLNHLQWDEQKKNLFVKLAKLNSVKDKELRDRLRQTMAQDFKEDLQAFELEESHFRIVSEWYHFAILELTSMKDFRSDPEWIARKLGIKRSDAADSIERLLKLGLLVKRGPKLIRESRHYKAKETPSAAIREHHHQSLQLAQAAIERQSFQERTFGSLTISINKADYPRLKKKIDAFRREISRDFTSESSDRVYKFCTQLFRLCHD